MQLNRFWSSVWSVAKFLLSVGLLQYIAALLLGLIGRLGVVPGALMLLVQVIVVGLVPIAGALTYIDWLWNWKPEHIGMPRTPAAVWHTLLGLLIGAAAGLLAAALSGLLTGQRVVLPTLALSPVSAPMVLTLVLTLLIAFATELIFRGAAISRYQADLSPREVLLAATLTPFGWLIVQRLVGFGGPPAGMLTPTEMAMSVFLALLFLRTDSVWLSAGLRAGALGLIVVMPTVAAGSGGPLLWGAAAAILLALELLRQGRMPRRMQPNRRTIRGPWGPH